MQWIEYLIRTLHQQQIPKSTQTADQMKTSNDDTIYEEDPEKDLKTQMQPISQNYSNRIKRPLPINLSLDMSTLIQMQQHWTLSANLVMATYGLQYDRQSNTSLSQDHCTSHTSERSRHEYLFFFFVSPLE